MAATTTIHAKLSILPAGLSQLTKIENNKPLITLLLEGKTQQEQTKLLENKLQPQTLFPLDLVIKRKEGDEIVLNFKEKNIQIIAKLQQPQGKFEVERDKAIDKGLAMGLRLANPQSEKTFEDQIFITMLKTCGFSEVKLEEINVVKANPKTLNTVNVKLIQKKEYNFDWIEYDVEEKKTKKEEPKKSEEHFSKNTEGMFKGMFSKKA